MGEQVKIIALARDLIRLSGFEPDVDIKMEIVGLRPGEKLHEELVGYNERVERTIHKKIMSITSDKIATHQLMRQIEELEYSAAHGDVSAVTAKIKEIIPSFTNDKILTVNSVGSYPP